jgi:hypothetical protein
MNSIISVVCVAMCLASFVFFPFLYCKKLHLKKVTNDETKEFQKIDK